MAAFDININDRHRLDWQILQNGWTSLYYQISILDNDLNWFRSEKYEIIDFDCQLWTEEERMHKDFKKKLDFPDYYGENFNALNDCLSEYEIKGSGTVIVFHNFHNVDKSIAHTLLDIFALSSRQHILFGEKLLTFVQVDNPNYQIEPVGATPVLWNGAEWLNSNRGL